MYTPACAFAAVYANGAVDASYDYAVPELGTQQPLLNAADTRGQVGAAGPGSDQDSVFSKGSSRGSRPDDKKVSEGTWILRGFIFRKYYA